MSVMSEFKEQKPINIKEKEFRIAKSSSVVCDIFKPNIWPVLLCQLYGHGASCKHLSTGYFLTMSPTLLPYVLIQQDGAIPHFSSEACQLRNEKLPDLLAGRGG